MKNNMQICFTGANIMKKALENPRLFSGSRGSRTPDPLLVRQML